MSTLGEIIERFRYETRDFARICSAEAVGDGVSLFFQIPDYPIVEDSLWVRLQTGDEAPVDQTERWTVDLESGQFHLTGIWLTTPPSDEQKLLWSWQWTRWSQLELMNYVNAGVRYIGQEYEVEQEDDTLVTVDNTYEYAVPAGAKRITKVELRYSDDDRWRISHNWRSRTINGVPRIIFKFNPGEQQLRVTTVSRPTLFLTSEPDPLPDGWVSVLGQTLEDTGLPDEAFEPLLWYTLWQAFESKLTHRSRDDAAQHAKEESTVTMRDLEARSSKIKTIFDLHYGHFQTEYIEGRLVP